MKFLIAFIAVVLAVAFVAEAEAGGRRARRQERRATIARVVIHPLGALLGGCGR